MSAQIVALDTASRERRSKNGNLVRSQVWFSEFEHANLDSPPQRSIERKSLTVGDLRDLRQPLQALVLLQELLAKVVVDDNASKLLNRFDQALGTMSGMLDALLDTSRIDDDSGRVEFGPFRSDAAHDQTATQLTYPAGIQDRVFRVSTTQLLDQATASGSVIYIVDDDSDVRDAFRSMLEADGHVVEEFADAETFFETFHPGRNACLLVDANLPGMNGLDLLKRLKAAGHSIPAIMVSGRCEVLIAVEAMKAGAADFLEKPVHGAELLAAIGRALELSRDAGKLTERRKDAVDHLACLTTRQHQIMEMVLAGHPSKNIAADLGISQRTVENHRASIMKKAGVRSLPALARLALAAAGTLVAHRSLAAISEALTV